MILKQELCASPSLEDRATIKGLTYTNADLLVLGDR
jgi:hypothetical protein